MGSKWVDKQSKWVVQAEEGEGRQEFEPIVYGMPDSSGMTIDETEKPIFQKLLGQVSNASNSIGGMAEKMSKEESAVLEKLKLGEDYDNAQKILVDLASKMNNMGRSWGALGK
jgi:hypothetical protein